MISIYSRSRESKNLIFGYTFLECWIYEIPFLNDHQEWSSRGIDIPSLKFYKFGWFWVALSEWYLAVKFMKLYQLINKLQLFEVLFSFWTLDKFYLDLKWVSTHVYHLKYYPYLVYRILIHISRAWRHFRATVLTYTTTHPASR